jgi:hypothetical protein
LTETEHIAKLLRLLRTRVAGNGVVFKHQDARTTGIPDLSVTLGGKTSWWEGKVVRHDRVTGVGLQHQVMRELAVAGTAWYVVWDGIGVGLVEPRYITPTGKFTCYRFINNDDVSKLNEYVIDFILLCHRSAT